jgi:hypothetical protein
MSKGWGIALLAGLALAGVVSCAIRDYANRYNPVVHGKRVYTWANQAMSDPDPAARQEAAQVLVEAVRSMEGEPRTQLVMRFCNTPEGDWEKCALPKEVLPVLLEALRAKDIPPGSYPAMASRLVDPADSVPALTEMMQRETDEEVKKRIKAALDAIRSWPCVPANHHAP